MKTILRNFLITLARFKLSSILNIFGLSIAFAAFIIILIQVRYERNFDMAHSKTGRIYRVEVAADSTEFYPIFSRPAIDQLGSSVAQVEAYSLAFTLPTLTLLSYETPNGSIAGIKESVTSYFPAIVDIFDFDMVEGTSDALEEPGKILIPQSLARRLFGKTSPIDRRMLNELDSASYVIGGVYRDFPANVSIKNDIITSFGDKNMDKWGDMSYTFFVLLSEGARPATVSDIMTGQMGDHETFKWMGNNITFRLTPIEDIYYLKDTKFDMLPKGDRTSTNILLAIAMAVIVIAGINFINFSTSLVPIRIKSINTQKVLGSPVGSIRFSIIFEAVGICLFAFLLSLIWVLIFYNAISSILITQVPVSENLPVICQVFGLAIAVGILSGLYPAYYITSFPPAMVLKGSFGLSPQGRHLRTFMIGFQFVISIGLTAGALFLHLQNQFLRNFNGGLNNDQLVMVELSREQSLGKLYVFKDKLKSSPHIADFAFAGFPVGFSDTYPSHRRALNDGSEIQYYWLPVSYNFPQMMGLEVVDGRNFESGDENKEIPTFICNQKAALQYGLSVNDDIQRQEIVGIVKDFNFMTLRKNIEPMMLSVQGMYPRSPLQYAFIRTKGSVSAAVADIRQSMLEIDPLNPVEIEFYDQAFAQAYEKEQKATKQITISCLLAVFISLFGVFGVVMFETQYRRKEIGVRKVFGSSIREILIMFNKSFIIVIAVCFVIAVPLAYIGVSGWLEEFAYRIPLYWWVFALALLIVAFITITTVTIQSWRAAAGNPVDSLRGE